MGEAGGQPPLRLLLLVVFNNCDVPPLCLSLARRLLNLVVLTKDMFNVS